MQPTETQRQTLSKIRELRDQIELEIHLAGMEAKERWYELETRVREFERKEAIKSPAARELLATLEKFRASLRS